MIIQDAEQQTISIQKFACLSANKLTFICWERIMPYFIEYAVSLGIFSFFITFDIDEQRSLIPFTSFYKDCTFVYPTNIHMIHLTNCALQPNCLMFNSEQMSIPQRLESTKSFLQSGGKLFDYSAENCFLLREFPKSQVLHLPYRCTDREQNVLRNLMAREKKEFDVAVVASMTPRRVKIVALLTAAGVKVCVIKEKFGIERDRLIARSRCLLNIHANDNFTIFETLRCLRWLDAGFPVITEPCTDLSTDFHPCLTIVPEENLVSACRNLQDINVSQTAIDYAGVPIEKINKWLNKSVNPKTEGGVLICYGAEDRFVSVSVDKNPSIMLINKEDNFNALYGDPAPNVVKNLTIVFDDTMINIPEQRHQNYTIAISNEGVCINKNKNG